jgi:purine-nucleoside/S-methyl-5'-thioadenosine phosphorylase / adenosine deaminase
MSAEHVALDLPGGSVLFTSRHGGVSEGPYASLNLGLWTEDDRERVLENRERVAALAGIPRERFAQGRQVHGTHVRALDAPPPPGEAAEADGQATSAPGVAPIALTADCLPVALVAPEAVAMLHCGWRGLAGGIVAHGVLALRGLGATSIAAAIGPGAARCCYETGDDVRDAFTARLGDEVVDGRRLDLKLVARRDLEAAGASSVEDVGICTMCSSDYFSHRRDGGVTGRQAGVVWRA